MKKFFCSTTSLAIAALFLLSSTSVFSQKNITWKGGTPGKETDWNCPKNWSTYSVPDAFSNVVIPDVSTTTLASPVIDNGRVEVNSLFLETNAHLTVEETAQLVIFEQAGSYFQDNIQLKGMMFILDGLAERDVRSSAAIR